MESPLLVVIMLPSNHMDCHDFLPLLGGLLVDPVARPFCRSIIWTVVVVEVEAAALLTFVIIAAVVRRLLNTVSLSLFLPDTRGCSAGEPYTRRYCVNNR